MCSSWQKSLAGVLTLILLPWSVAACAQTMRICVDEETHAPFITASGGGMLGRLIREASREAGLRLSFHSAPVARCRERMRLGEADAFPTTPFTAALTPLLVYPTKANMPDQSRAVVNAKAFVFRRIGSKVGWDGQHFSALDSRVLIPTSAVLLSDRLNALGVPYDDAGKTLEQNFLKLAAGRADLAIGAEYSGLQLLANPKFRNTLERLPAPFTEEPYYLAVTVTYYAGNTKVVEAMWRAIARIRASAQYRADFEKAMLEAEKKARMP